MIAWWKQNKSYKNPPWLLIFLVALILRLAPVIAFKDLGIGLDDMYQYDMLARSLASGDGFRWYAEEDLPLVTSYLHLDLENFDYDPRGILTSFRPPLYPAFLAVIYFITGITAQRFFIARLVQVFLASTLVPLTYALARRFFPKKRRVATLAAWCIALYPMLVIYPLSLATENLFFILITSAVLALVVACQGEPTQSESHPAPFFQFILQSRWHLVAGLLLGLAGLTRSVSLGLAFIAMLWLWFIVKQKKQAVLVLAMVVLVVAPWMVRNSLLHHRLVGVESALGYDLYVGYHPEGTGTFQYPQSLDLMTILDDGLRDELGQARALEFIKADPARVPYLFFRRLGHFFGLERRALTYFYSNNFFGYLKPSLLVPFAIFFCLPFVLVSLSAIPALVSVNWNRERNLLLLVMGGYILPHLLIIAEDRFHLTMLPFLAILASYSWVEGFPLARQRWKTAAGKWLMIIALVVMLLLVANWSLELVRDWDKLLLLFGPSGNETFFPY